MFETYIGTTNGVYRLTDSGVESRGLDLERIEAIYAERDNGQVTILAGSYGNGLFRSRDGGGSWDPINAGLTASAFRCIAPDPLSPSAILAGTEPARLFRSWDGGGTWQELSGITRIPGDDSWYLPYSPRAGALRNVYAPPNQTHRLFASVEVGGLLRSDDGGGTWTCEPVIEDVDIHFITGHPDDANLLFASLGYASPPNHQRRDAHYHYGGIARSRDGGKTWQKLEADYTRATLVPPSRPDLVVAGPAPEVGRDGRIVVSSNSGDTWDLASTGLATPMPDMVELFVAAPDQTIWAMTSSGRLFWSTAGEWSWQSALPDDGAPRVQSISFVATQ